MYRNILYKIVLLLQPIFIELQLISSISSLSHNLNHLFLFYMINKQLNTQTIIILKPKNQNE